MEKKSDRRKYLRARFEGPVLVQAAKISQGGKSGDFFEARGKPLSVKAFDLCEEGIRLESEGIKPSNGILKLNIGIRKGKGVDLYCRLIWNSEKFVGYKFIFFDGKEEKCVRDFLRQSN